MLTMLGAVPPASASPSCPLYVPVVFPHRRAPRAPPADVGAALCWFDGDPRAAQPLLFLLLLLLLQRGGSGRHSCAPPGCQHPQPPRSAAGGVLGDALGDGERRHAERDGAECPLPRAAPAGCCELRCHPRQVWVRGRVGGGRWVGLQSLHGVQGPTMRCATPNCAWGGGWKKEVTVPLPGVEDMGGGTGWGGGVSLEVTQVLKGGTPIGPDGSLPKSCSIPFWEWFEGGGSMVGAAGGCQCPPCHKGPSPSPPPVIPYTPLWWRADRGWVMGGLMWSPMSPQL